MRREISAALFGCTLVWAASASVLYARDDASQAGIEARPLLKEPLAGEPGREVSAQYYTFAPGASVSWHIHPDAHEIAYILQGTLTFERADEEPIEIKAGEADYLPPNVVHRGLNKGSEPLTMFVVRIKPEDKPLAVEVDPPSVP